MYRLIPVLALILSASSSAAALYTRNADTKILPGTGSTCLTPSLDGEISARSLPFNALAPHEDRKLGSSESVQLAQGPGGPGYPDGPGYGEGTGGPGGGPERPPRGPGRPHGPGGPGFDPAYGPGPGPGYAPPPGPPDPGPIGIIPQVLPLFFPPHHP